MGRRVRNRQIDMKLSSFVLSDFKILLSWVKSEKDLKQWAGSTIFSWPLDENQLLSYIKLSTSDNPTAHIYKVVDEHNVMIGLFEFADISNNGRTAVLSRVIVNPAYRGKGIGKEMVNLAIQEGFDNLKFSEIKLKVFTFNAPAVKCYESVGFNVTEFIKSAYKYEESLWDGYVMSMFFEKYCDIKNRS